MSVPLSIAVYFIIWWTTLFAVLPIGVRTQREAGDIVPGTPEGAPASFSVIRVLGINTAVATVVFIFVWFAITRGWIPLDIIMAKRQ
jgi:predicted secreted protein